jgi:hypothetical protein
MPIKRAFYVEDYDEVLAGLPDKFKAADFYSGVMATMPAKGPEGEDTTTDAFKKQVQRSVNNWLYRKLEAGKIQKAKRKGRAVWYVQQRPLYPAAPKQATKAPEEPQDNLTLLDIGKGIEALLNDRTERKDKWKKQYHDLLQSYEKLQGELRDIRTDKENLNRQLDRQNSEILRLRNEASQGRPSVVKMSDVVRFKTNFKTKR